LAFESKVDKEDIMFKLVVACLATMLAVAVGRAEPGYRVLPLVNTDFSQDWGPESVGQAPNGWTLFASDVGSRGDYSIETIWKPDPRANCLKFRSGNTSSRVGVYQRVDLNQTVAYPVYVEMFGRGDRICIDPNTNFGLSLYVEVYYQDGSRGFFNTKRDWGTFNQDNCWRVYALNLNYAQFNPATQLYDVLPLPKPINHLFVIPFLADASGEALIDNVQVREYNVNPSPAVSIEFDDAESSVYSVAWPELRRRGYKGSLVVPINNLDTEGYMTRNQVRELAADGWSIVSHGYDNDLGGGQGMRVYSPCESRPVFRGGRNDLEALSATRVEGFAFPFGAYESWHVGVGQQYYSFLRLFEQRVNPPGSPRYTLGARGAVFTTTAASVRDWLRDTRDRGAWMILSLHGIKDSDTDNFYNTFAQFSSYLNEVAASGLRVITTNQAVSEFCANPQGGIYGGNTTRR
jgi:peptidoglycan/xylan/chitin deacetylase (PgdA/CDA1 family)